MAEAAALLAEAARVWAKAQVVFEGPSWEGQPSARVLVDPHQQKVIRWIN